MASGLEQQMVDEAAAWHARIGSGDVSADEWHALATWLEEDAARRETFESMEQMARPLQALADQATMRSVHDNAFGAVPGKDQADGGRPRGWWFSALPLAIAASMLAVIMIPVLYFSGAGVTPTITSLETAVGERRTVELDDGSSVALSADSRVQVTISEGQRQLVLRRGEIFVDVVSDAAWPFSVEAGSHIVTSIGTSFEVRYRHGAAEVTVHEGSVRVEPTAVDTGIGRMLHLQQGQRLELGAGASPGSLSDEELRRSGDWRNGWLHFDNDYLAVVASELAPFVDKQIILTSRKAETLLVGGSFNVDELQDVWSTMATVLPVEVSEESDRIVISYLYEDTGSLHEPMQ